MVSSAAAQAIRSIVPSSKASTSQCPTLPRSAGRDALPEITMAQPMSDHDERVVRARVPARPHPGISRTRAR